MEITSKAMAKNMYSQIIERIDDQAGSIIEKTLDCANRMEFAKSLLKETLSDMKTLRQGLRDDLKIVDKNI